MSHFRPTRPKSYSRKETIQLPGGSDSPVNHNEPKSMFIISPRDHISFNIHRSNNYSIFRPDNSVIYHPQSHNRFPDEIRRHRTQSVYDYVPKDDSDSLEEIQRHSFVSEGINPQDKRTIRIEPPNSASKPLRYRPNENDNLILNRAGLDRIIPQSITELGPNDVEITDRDIDKTSKMTTMRIDLNPFSDRKRQLDTPLESARYEPTLSTARAPLITDPDADGYLDTRSPDELAETDRMGPLLTETYPLTGGLLDSPKGDYNFELEVVSEDLDSHRVQVDMGKTQHKKSQSVSFTEKNNQSKILQLKENAKKNIMFQKFFVKNVKNEENHQAQEPAKKHVRQKSKDGRAIFAKKKPDVPEKTTTPVSTSTAVTASRIAIMFQIVSYLFFIYVLMPFGMFFAAYDYKQKIIKGILNFGILGFLQGLVQVILLYYLIDVPILTKIREVEGKNRGLIDPRLHVVVNKFISFIVLVLSMGFQIALGIIIVEKDVNVTGTIILIICLCTTLFKGLIWLIIVFVKTPKSLRNEEKIFKLELKEIHQIRKEFVSELNDARLKLALPSSNENIKAGAVSTAFLGFSTGLVSSVQNDSRKLLHKVYDFSSEFKRIRQKSNKTFIIILLSLAQILVLFQVIKLVEKTDSLPLSLVFVLVIFVIGSVFGLFDVFTKPTRPVLNTMKLVTIIVTAGIYRFLFVDLSDKYKMIGAAVIRLLYTMVMYYFEAFCSEKLLSFFKKEKKPALVIEHYDSIQDREAAFIKRPIYVFQKFMVLQEVDLFFAVVSLYLTRGANTWLVTDDLNFGLKVEYIFYLGLVLVEMAAHVILVGIVMWLTNKVVKQRAKTITVGLGTEFLNVMRERKWVIIGFKGLMLYISLFTFFNEI